MMTSVTRPCFTTQPPVQDLQDQDRFLIKISDRSCPKTDDLRSHHWLTC